MAITKHELDQTFNYYNKKYGGLKEDYFALLYLSKEFKQPIEEIAQKVAFGGNDYGIDAFFIDEDRRNLYLFQFKWSENHHLFKDSFKRLIEAGMDRIFGNPLQDKEQNQLLLQLKSKLNENQAIIDRVLIHFVFNGDPDAADRSAVLDNLQEELESKKYLIDQYFEGRKVSLTLQFISNQTKKLAGISHITKTHKYKINFAKKISTTAPNREILYVGFIPLIDLYYMYQEMGQRFYERNIRAGLSAEKPPNRAIRRALARIVLQGDDPPDVFVFNHNGVTLAAERLEFEDNERNVLVTEPRILNGAQTVTSLVKFLKDNENNPALKNNEHKLRSICVLSKILCAATKDFVVNVTICNNQQNPVKPWNLHANDPIQLALQDKFREELIQSIYYERQEEAFENLTDDELKELGIE